MASGNIMGVELNLNQEYIKGAVEEIVKAGIIQALGDPAAIVKTAINQTINQKVDHNGKPSTSYSAQPYLDWLAAKTVETVVREAVHEMVKEHSESLKAEIKNQLNTKRFRNEMATRFLDQVLKAGENDWRMPITVDFTKPREY